MYPDECEDCGRETPFLVSGKLCRLCHLAQKNGGYPFPEYLEGYTDRLDPTAEKLCDDLQVMLAKYAEFEARYGQ